MFNCFFDWFGLRARWLRFICSDQHKPYLAVIARRASKAVHVLDRFHIVQRLNKAVDQVRAAEVKRLERDRVAPGRQNDCERQQRAPGQPPEQI